MAGSSTVVARSTGWLLAVLGAWLAYCSFEPGFLSWDGAYQWKQAREGVFDSLHPPLQTILWSWIEPYWSGPGSMLALQLGMIWLGLGGIAAELIRQGRSRWLLLLPLLVGFWPPLFALSGHIWKDLPMMGALGLACWMLLREWRTGAASDRCWAFGFLVLACACRHNAITAALPWLAWISYRQWGRASPSEDRSGLTRWLAWAGGSVLLAAGCQGLAKLPDYAPGVQRSEAVWSVVALWDFAAVSILEDRLIMPEPFRLADTTVADLRPHFTEFSNTTVFESGKLIPTLGSDFGAEDIAELRVAWWRLPFEHPRAYWSHRLRLTALLFGFDNPALPDFMVLAMAFTPMEGNPPIVAEPAPWRQGLIERFNANSLIDGPLFMGWIYLLLALLVALRQLPGALRLQPGHGWLVLLLAASAWCYAAPLIVVSGSAEFRYLAWPIQASLLAMLVALRLGRRSPPGPGIAASTRAPA